MEKPKIELLFEKLIEYLSSEQKPYIILRHHFDGDGNTSAAIIEQLLRLFGLKYKKLTSVQNKYTMYDLINDRNFFRNMIEKIKNNNNNNNGNNLPQKIVLFILDYGSNEETALNISNLKKYLIELGFDPFFVLIDHHMMENPKLTKRAFDLVYHHLEKNTSFLAREFFF